MRTDVGKPERASQNRVLKLFQDMGYYYLGDWEDEVRTQPVEENILNDHLKSQGYSDVLVQKAIDKIVSATTNLSGGLYEANKSLSSTSLWRYCSRGTWKTERNRLVNKLERY